MNAIIKRAHEIRAEAAARFGGKAGQYDMGLACKMAKKEILKDIFNAAAKQCVTGFKGIQKLITKKALELGHNIIDDNALVDVVGNLYAEYKDQKQYPRFSLFINMAIDKI